MQYYYPQQPQQPQQAGYPRQPQQPVYPQQLQQTGFPQQAQQTGYPQPQQPAYPAQPQQTAYPQYQQAYPPQPAAPMYPQQLTVPQQQPVVPQMTPEQYAQQQKTQQYRRGLRRTANSLGALMLIFFGFEMILAIVVIYITSAFGVSGSMSETDALSLLENGVISSIVFFFIALIYCLIRKVNFASTFPFSKIGGAKLAKLCVIGLSFSLMSNYVVDLINNTFGLFGVENSGGSFEVGSNPSVIVYFLTVAILPAFAEEFAFRGVAMGLLRPYSPSLAIIVSSALFALMHGNFVQLPFTFCCGLVFAYIDIKTNSLLPSIIIHFLNNGLSVAADILMSYGILSEFMANAAYGAIFAVTGILSFIFIKQMTRDDKDFFRLEKGDDIIPYREKVKLAVTSPTLIIFTAIMLSYCVFYLTSLS